MRNQAVEPEKREEEKEELWTTHLYIFVCFYIISNSVLADAAIAAAPSSFVYPLYGVANYYLK